MIYLHIFSPKTLTSFNKHPIFLHRFLNWKVLNIVRSDRGLKKRKEKQKAFTWDCGIDKGPVRGEQANTYSQHLSLQYCFKLFLFPPSTFSFISFYKYFLPPSVFAIMDGFPNNCFLVLFVCFYYCYCCTHLLCYYLSKFR